jgi:hypothetical protein
MKILSVSFQGVRGVRDVALDFAGREGAPHPFVALVGPAACGKTRALETILAAKEAIAPYGLKPRSASFIAPGQAEAKVRIAFHLDTDEQKLANVGVSALEANVTFTPDRARAEAEAGLVAVLERYAHDPAQGKVEYFPAARSIPVLPPFGGMRVTEQRILRAGSDPRKYGFVVRFLRELHGDPEQEQDFAARLEALSPTVRYVPGDPGEGLPRCLAAKGGEKAAPDELSESEVDAVIFAATATAIGLSCSLVLADRPDLYVDPAQARAFATGLRRLGQDNQIVCTASPAFADAASAHTITLQPPS